MRLNDGGVKLYEASSRIIRMIILKLAMIAGVSHK
jgi:hypothetical protein